MRTVLAFLLVLLLCCTGCSIKQRWYGQPDMPTPTVPTQLDPKFSNEVKAAGPMPQTDKVQASPSSSLNELFATAGGGYDSEGNGSGAWFLYLHKLRDERLGVAPTWLQALEMATLGDDPNAHCSTEGDIPSPLPGPTYCLTDVTGTGKPALALLPYGFEEKLHVATIQDNSTVGMALAAALLYAKFLDQEMPRAGSDVKWPQAIDYTKTYDLDDCVAGITLRSLLPAGMDDQLQPAYALLTHLDLIAGVDARHQIAQQVAATQIGYDGGDITKCVS